MHRETVIPSVDKHIYARTAARTREMNIYPKIMRGGTRL